MVEGGARPAVIVAVVGPTASGKSDLGVDLALALGGEIVNADAMQFYQGMDVGTAKLSLTQRRGVPHHLLDVLTVTDEASVAVYQEQARAALTDIAARGRRPILVGGSGLYVRAALDDLEIPPTDPVVRARVEQELVQVGAPALHARLRAVDPEAAAHILASNGRRIVRALEVIELTGRPFSATMPVEQYRQPCVQLGLTVPREVLDERIAVRVQQMWDAGLVAEVRELSAAGLLQGRTASRALGYAQVLRLLSGEVTAAQAQAETVRATCKLARRQQAWFARDRRIIWLPFDAPDLLARALSAVSNAESGGRHLG